MSGTVFSVQYTRYCLLGLNQKEETVAIEILVASARRALNETLAGRLNKRHPISRQKLRAQDAQTIAENRRRLTDRLVRCLTPMILKVPIPVIFWLNLVFTNNTVSHVTIMYEYLRSTLF